MPIADFWDSYYQPNRPNSRPIFRPLFSRGIMIGHNPQFCLLVYAMASKSCRFDDCWDIYFLPNPPSIFDLLFFRAELSSVKTHCSFHWNRLILQRGINFWLLRQFLSIRPNPLPEFIPPSCFQAELSSGTTQSSVGWYRLILQRGINCWLLRQFLFTKSLPRSSARCFRAELS